MRILLVEDTEVCALPVIDYLEQHGMQVMHASDGDSAMRLYDCEEPDLVLLDVVLPDISGIEVARKMKERGNHKWIPVVLLTALSSDEQIIAGLNAGADDYLTKPVNLEVLKAKIHSMQRISTLQDTLLGVVENVYEAIVTIDGKGIIETFNKSAEKIFGYQEREVVGKNVKILMPHNYAEQHDGFLAKYQNNQRKRIVGSNRKFNARRKNGELFPIRMVISELPRASSTHFIGLISDISKEESSRKYIEFLALHDALTGLPNRINFTDALELTLRSAARHKHAVLFIDLDGFKPINDSYGHEFGDEALKTIAGRLRHQLAGNDFAARLGGDEFVAIARNVSNRASVEMIAQRLLRSISDPMVVAGKKITLGASIGVAMFPEHGTTPSKILSAADTAMYEAKHAGKGCVCFAETPPQENEPTMLIQPQQSLG